MKKFIAIFILMLTLVTTVGCEQNVEVKMDATKPVVVDM